MEVLGAEFVLVNKGKRLVVTPQTVSSPIVIKVQGSDLGLNLAFALAWSGFPDDHILETGYQLCGHPGFPQPENQVSRSYVGPYFRWEVSGFWSTVAEEISLGGPAPINQDDKRLLSLLDIDRLWSRDPLKLSGGETARVILAAHILSHPRYLVLDRVLGELDIEARSRLISGLKEALPDTVVVIVDDSASGYFDLIVSTEGQEAEWTRDRGSQSAASKPVPNGLRLWSVRTAPVTRVTSIQLQGFCVLRNGKRVFDPVDLQVSGGDLIFLIGANGCGKTTFLEGLAGLLPADGKASLTRDGQEIRPGHFAALSPQDPQCDITECTVQEELSLACGTSERANQFLIEIGFLESSVFRPLHDEIALQKIASVLAAIARGRPACLLDEPSLYLGTELRAVAVRAFRKYLAAGGIGFCSSHDQRFVSDLMADQAQEPRQREISAESRQPI